MAKQKEKREPLEEGLLKALQALDRQIAREMQRTPAEREEFGVQKWQPYQKRIELVCALLLNEFGDGNVSLDGFIVLSQALVKSLQLLIEDLGEEGLGSVRSDYCRWALENIQQDCFRGALPLHAAGPLN
ncbi:MAG: hypothetical protein KDD66_12315 [Bdellovibrionales bacterium]|nr:hypothetical protein [Bdellovibrionales bacterium]